MNNITADAHRNGNVKTFASPALLADTPIMGIVQLFGAAQAVPEPTTFGFLAAGSLRWRPPPAVADVAAPDSQVVSRSRPGDLVVARARVLAACCVAIVARTESA